MKKTILYFVAPAILVATTLVSCKKDQTTTTDSTPSEVTTPSNGTAYIADVATSKIEWKGYKILKSESSSHFGTINLQSADLTVKEGKLESGKFVADMKSLTATDIKDDADMLGKLNGHLMAPDFFDVEKFPTATYEITKVSDLEEGDYNTLIDGNMTIKGITKPVQLKANVTANNGEVTIATEPKDVMREDFDVKFQSPIENGVIKNEITLQMNIKATEKK